jgi:hypothetical protein
MPITAKLSQRFYQKLGDEVTNELVDWLNAVDTSYRQEFRELFEANFGRLEARMGELRAELLAHLDGRVGGLRADTDVGFAGLRADMNVGFAGLRADMEAMEARMDAKLEALKSELLRWMFLFWVGTMGTVLAIVKL